MAHPAGNGLARKGQDVARSAWQGIRTGARHVHGAWRRVATPPARIDPARMDAAMAGTRSLTLVFALWIFVAGFSVDDLGVLRVPGYLVAVIGATLMFSLGSIVQARALIVNNLHLDLGQFQLKMQVRGRAGQLLLVITVLGTIAWFMVFSNGEPPWAV